MRLEHILLGLLARGALSGYDIGKWMQQEGRYYRSNTDQSQIYRVLRAMEKRGWVCHAVESRPTAPDAKVYALTAAGRAELLAWARSPYEPPSRFQDGEFHARFDFAGGLDAEALRALIVTELDARRSQVAEGRGRDRTRVYRDAVPELDIDRANVLAEMSHRRGAAEIDRWIEWLESTLADLDARGLTRARSPLPEKENP